MAFISPALLEGARMVMRQATETVLTTLSTAEPNPTGSSLSVASASSSPSTAIVLTTPAPSPTVSSTLVNGGGSSNGNGNPGGNNSNGSTSNSSSLLFFVALGFGVVFTNLWIIVGVKYCFRYNARNRQMRTEDGEPINMENVPRPHRRRREKKLMTIDEVNEKFPMQKYKAWVASRAREGLPTRGGVSAPSTPPSRPASIRDSDGVPPELPPKERMSTEDRPTTSATGTGISAATTTAARTDEAAATATKASEQEDPAKPEAQSPQHAPSESTSSAAVATPRPSADVPREPDAIIAQKHMSQVSHEDDDDDEYEHIDAALPPECLGTSGDTCAICIDTLEDDDDVRGLTCGHAFHAVCLDPWLTTRRASCPLCKADYYTPKPRPQAAEGTDSTPGVITVTVHSDSRNNRINFTGRPPYDFFGFSRPERRAASQHASGRQRTIGGSGSRDSNGPPGSFFRVPWRTRNNAEPQAPPPDRTGQGGGGGLFPGLRAAFHGRRHLVGQNNQPHTEPVVSGANPAVTPSQLEAGVRNTPS
ncbi:hypothetical protein VTK56DRAFT_3822 [Thermocarpiscus australiensis]